MPPEFVVKQKQFLDSCEMVTTYAKLRRIVEITSKYYKMGSEHILGESRINDAVLVRHVCMYVAITTVVGLTARRLGRFFRKDHTTVLYATRRINALMKLNPNIMMQVSELTALVERKDDTQAEGTE